MSDIDYDALLMRADSWSARGDIPLAAIETMHQMAAAIRTLRADLSESRRLLDEAREQSESESIAYSAMRAEKERLQGIIDEARAQKPAAWASPNVLPLRGNRDNHPAILTATECSANTVPIFLAAPVPAQPAAVPELVRYCCSCQSVGEVDPRSVSCCPDAPGSVGYVSARFASRLAREFNVVRNGSAAAPEAVAKNANEPLRAAIYAWFPLRLSKKRQLISDYGITIPQGPTESDSQWAMRALHAMLERPECRAAILSAADTEVKK